MTIGMLTRIKVHNSHWLSAPGLLAVELHVTHLQGDHYEVWRGCPGNWEGPLEKITRKRRRALDREYRRERQP